MYSLVRCSGSALVSVYCLLAKACVVCLVLPSLTAPVLHLCFSCATSSAPFMQAVTDAILERDEADMTLAVAALKAAGLSITDKDRQWFDSRVKRHAPQGPVMQANVLKVIEQFSDKVCPLTGEPIITEQVKKTYQQQGVADILLLDGKLYNTWDLTAGETCAVVHVVAGVCGRTPDRIHYLLLSQLQIYQDWCSELLCRGAVMCFTPGRQLSCAVLCCALIS